MSLMLKGLEEPPPTTTVARRGSSHEPMILISFLWIPNAASLASILGLETLSKAPETSEQYTCTFCPASMAFTHRNVSKARASLEPLSLQ